MQIGIITYLLLISLSGALSVTHFDIIFEASNLLMFIVGGVAGGASTAARCRRHSEEDTIIMFEKGPHVSFSNCCLPYHLSGVVATAEELILMSPK